MEIGVLQISQNFFLEIINKGYYLLRDNNLKWYVKYEEILRVFNKILKPLYKSYELIRNDYNELLKLDEVFGVVKYHKDLISGIGELHLFKTPAGEANLENEFTPEQQWNNLGGIRNALKYKEVKWFPSAINNDFESTIDVRLAIEPSQMEPFKGWELVPNKENLDQSEWDEGTLFLFHKFRNWGIHSIREKFS